MNSWLSRSGKASKRKNKPVGRLWDAIRAAVVTGTVIGALFTSGAAHAQPNIEQIVTQKVQPILPKTGSGGGVAVAVGMNGNTSFFNYGMAFNAQKRQVTADSNFYIFTFIY